MFDSCKESVELFCVHAREKLTNSIRLQWRKLKNHVERLDSQGITFKLCHIDMIRKVKLLEMIRGNYYLFFLGINQNHRCTRL